jgi:hypothetical protein
MDRGIKFLLAVIAVSLIILNLQIANVSVLPEAKAQSFYDVENGLDKCAKSLENIATAIQDQDFN